MPTIRGTYWGGHGGLAELVLVVVVCRRLAEEGLYAAMPAVVQHEDFDDLLTLDEGLRSQVRQADGGLVLQGDRVAGGAGRRLQLWVLTMAQALGPQLEKLPLVVRKGRGLGGLSRAAAELVRLKPPLHCVHFFRQPSVALMEMVVCHEARAAFHSLPSESSPPAVSPVPTQCVSAPSLTPLRWILLGLQQT